MAENIPRGSSKSNDNSLLGKSETAFIPEEFKGLKRFQREQDIKIIRGTGEGFAEVFFKGEAESPLPESNVVQVRDTHNFKPNEVATADMLHFIGGINPDSGKPFDKKFFDLKQQFLAEMDVDTYLFAQESLRKAQDRGATGSNFENIDNFMQNVFGDMLIRGGLFPQLMTDPAESKAFKDRKPFTPEQSKILDKMNKIIR